MAEDGLDKKIAKTTPCKVERTATGRLLRGIVRKSESDRSTSAYDPQAEVETATISGRRTPDVRATQAPANFISCQCALLCEYAALLPWSRIENRAVDFAGCVSDEGDPRVIATLDLEFIF